jgi:hypothetical protein
VACGWEQIPRYLIHDRDARYGNIFVRRVRSLGIRDHPTSPRLPWQNGYAERLIGSIRRECLDHVVVVSEQHLRHTLMVLHDVLQRSAHASIVGQGCANWEGHSVRRAHRSATCAWWTDADLICARDTFLPWEGLARIGSYVSAMPADFHDPGEAEAYFREVLAPFGDLPDEHWSHITRHSVAWHPSRGRYVMLCDPQIVRAFHLALQRRYLEILDGDRSTDLGYPWCGFGFAAGRSCGRNGSSPFPGKSSDH